MSIKNWCFGLDELRVASNFNFSWLWVSIGCALVSLIVYLSLTPGPPKVIEFAFADKLEHLLAYGILMGWFGQLYLSWKSQLVWVLAFCLLGVGMEFAQGWGGHRFFDVADMAANSLGVLLGWWLGSRWLAGSLLRIDHILSRWLAKA